MATGPLHARFHENFDPLLSCLWLHRVAVARVAADAFLPAAPQMSLESLQNEQAVLALLFLEPECAARACATSKTHVLGVAARQEALWGGLMQRMYRLPAKTLQEGPLGENCGGSHMEAFRKWHAAGYHGAWQQLRQWLAKEAPFIASTLRPGVTRSREEHSALLEEFDLQDCLAGFLDNPWIYCLWEACDGQDGKVMHIGNQIDMQTFTGRDDSGWSHGLFGGYTVYDHRVCCLLLPLRSALMLTKFIKSKILPRQIGLTEWNLLIFGISFAMNKAYCVDVTSGCVFVLGLQTGQLESAVPKLPVDTPVTLHGLSAKPELNGLTGTLQRFDRLKGRWQVKMDEGGALHLLKPDNLDGVEGPPNHLLLWFKEYVRRLETGWYEAMALYPEAGPSSKGIRLFAENGPTQSRAVTRGVECTASCVYIPEHPQQGWTYSICFRLVGTAAERGFETCQLAKRVWNIGEDGQAPERVEGEGVIGLFPILCDGGWLVNEESDPQQQYGAEESLMEGFFRYQSCSGRLRSMSGSFSGELQFFPGTRRKPTGPPFMVRLDPFNLRVPEYLY